MSEETCFRCGKTFPRSECVRVYSSMERAFACLRCYREMKKEKDEDGMGATPL